MRHLLLQTRKSFLQRLHGRGMPAHDEFPEGLIFSCGHSARGPAVLISIALGDSHRGRHSLRSRHGFAPIAPLRELCVRVQGQGPERMCA